MKTNPTKRRPTFMRWSWKVILGKLSRPLTRLPPCWSSCEPVLEDTKLWLLDIPNVEILHIRREANQASHMLAKSALVHMLLLLINGIDISTKQKNKKKGKKRRRLNWKLKD
jgi:hypothetical protein